MKKLMILLCFAISTNVFGQIEGDWYGFFLRDSVQSRLDLHIIKKNSSDFSVTTDLPTDSKIQMPADHILAFNDAVYFTLDKYQLAVDAKLETNHERLKGEIVFGGRPYAILFTRHIPATDNLLRPVLRNVGEGADKSLSPDSSTARPIPPFKSVFVEELTWLDVRDAVREGKNTIIIATGGTEQSGPYVAMGKHNYILKVVTDSIARRLGNALVAPIVPFVPEGDFNPPTLHLKYAGSVSLKEETYELLLSDIAASYKAEGFRRIIFLGDSGGNQWGMYVVARKLNELWKEEGVEVFFIHEYYDNRRISKWLKEQGIVEGNEGIHDAYKVEAQIAVLDPKLIRVNERLAAGLFTINGINLSPLQTTIDFGKRILSYQTDIVVEAIRKRQIK